MTTPEATSTTLSPRQRTTPRPLLNVSQLREQLERIERHGGGHWEIDLTPDEGEIPRTASDQPDVAFELRRYGITSVTALGDGSQNFVLLRFAAVPLDGH
ncbi:hypothetical protein [Virgisporangium aurantiacum]|uniref:Uncharacterized protein n=1 Tax=Virgisporangium aurantiacum TaxID=175570 RepID=A0A8J4E1N5_9ACTN|nr:hypothetical protein [Virgisporangium aurantiacum]GIJ56157.1 hypothetical protein Vau01_036730 [Virgisporangium aurantiacum]